MPTAARWAGGLAARLAGVSCVHPPGVPSASVGGNRSVCVLFVTTVVDVLSNLSGLLTLSELRHHKLQNYAGELHARFWSQAVS